MRGLAATLRRLDTQPNRAYSRLGWLRVGERRALAELNAHAFRMSEAAQATGPRIVKPDGIKVISLATFKAAERIEPVSVTLLSTSRPIEFDMVEAIREAW